MLLELFILMYWVEIAMERQITNQHLIYKTALQRSDA